MYVADKILSKIDFQSLLENNYLLTKVSFIINLFISMLDQVKQVYVADTIINNKHFPFSQVCCWKNVEMSVVKADTSFFFSLTFCFVLKYSKMKEVLFKNKQLF